ncbi:MAG: hypothetical protein ABIP71_15615 [Verrucomicrobiota bacterium]
MSVSAGELTHHLGYDKGGERPAENCRKGASPKTRLTEERWGKKYPTIAASWKRHWEEVIPFYGYPPLFAKKSA